MNTTETKPSPYVECEKARRKLERLRQRAAEAEREIIASLSPEARRIWSDPGSET